MKGYLMEHLLSALSKWIESVISSGGYAGVMLLMALESACIPLPSEVIMPFAGVLTLASIAGSHVLNLHLVALSGAIGCALGSAVAYIVGASGGREFVFKYGKYILLRRRDVEKSEAWFQQRGAVTVFLARLLPVVRTFISLPAGIARMPFGRFLALSFIGSVPWCYLLAWIGVKVAGNIDVLKKYFHGADAIIGVGLLALFGYWLWHHTRPDHDASDPTKP
jgi:membrane protein DedA with SNARE-associated domain